MEFIMKATNKIVYLLLVLSLVTMTAYADNTGTKTLVGNYQCQRTDANNSVNSYTLAITDNGSTYTLEWDNANGYPVLYGTGVIHPDMKNLLSVSFSDPKNADTYGIELFAIKPDGSLQSNWALQSANQVGSETCTKK